MMGEGSMEDALYEALQEVEESALVTNEHCRVMAEQLADQLRGSGYWLVQVVPPLNHSVTESP